MSRRPVLIPLGCALVMLAALWAAADAHPVVRPIVERFAVLTLALTALAVVAMAAARAHPEPAVSNLDPAPAAVREPGTLPLELRRVATTFERPLGAAARRGQHVGGRSHIHRIGRQRLAARGLDPGDPDHADAVRALTGEHLFVLVSTPLDQPVRHVDLDAALDRLEAL